MRTPVLRHARRLAVSAISIFGVVALAGCHVSDLPGPTSDLSTLFQRIDVNQPVVTLTMGAPTNTMQLVVTPRAADGSVIETTAHPTYTSGDPGIVSVSPEGLITAVSANQTISVNVVLSIGNVTRFASVNVFVTDAPLLPTVGSFRFELAPGDSAKMAAQSGRQVPLRITDSDGNPLSLPVQYSQSNSAVASIDQSSGWLQAIAPGVTTVYATTTVGGSTYTDSMTFTFGLPLRATNAPVRHKRPDGTPYFLFRATEIRIPAGGTVEWYYMDPVAGLQYDVVFDHPELVDDDPSSYYSEGHGGNIAAWMFDPNDDGTSWVRVRKFPTPGQYAFHSATLNASGTVIVVDERACLPSCP